jgi:CRISPR-associated endonuclease/helicase Cas3
LLAPYGVGTVDQALLGIVAAKHFFIRQFGLAGKVVILDEVHSYDLYTGTLIDALVSRLLELHCTVMVLSATLTGARRRQLLQVEDSQTTTDAYPLISAGPGRLMEVGCEPPPPKTVAVRFAPVETLAGECLERAELGQCVLWVRNTVEDAQQTYRALKSANREGGPMIGLLHSRFPFHRREELESEWMARLGKEAGSRPRGCILVSTQIAEQSVDIDADLLVTDLAPTDMLLQRLGRLWRHERPQRPCPQPEVWIGKVALTGSDAGRATAATLKRILGKSGKVYAPYVLLRSLEEWRKQTAITLPTDIRKILEATYEEPDAGEPEAWRELRLEMEKKRDELKGLALSATRIWAQPALADEEGVQTRYSTYKTAQVLLATEIDRLDSHSARLRLLNGEVVTASDREWSFEAAKAMYRNLARLPRWAVAAALCNQPDWLANHVPGPTAVGRVGADGEIGWLGSENETGLSYHQEEGIIIDRERAPRTRPEDFDESYD